MLPNFVLGDKINKWRYTNANHLTSPMETTQDILSAAEAADYCKIGQRKLLSLAKKGAIPGLLIGEDWMFPRHQLYQALVAMAEAQQKERLRQHENPMHPAQTKPGRGRRRPLVAQALPQAHGQIAPAQGSVAPQHGQ